LAGITKVDPKILISGVIGKIYVPYIYVLMRIKVTFDKDKKQKE